MKTPIQNPIAQIAAVLLALVSPRLVSGQGLMHETQFGFMVEKQRTVLFHPTNLPPVQATNQQVLDNYGQRLITKISSRATVRFRAGNSLRMDENTILEIISPRPSAGGLAGRILQGGAYFAGHQAGEELSWLTPHGTVMPIGTEFALQIGNDQTSVVMLDGTATLSNALGDITVKTGELGVIQPGQPPRTARLEASNIIQWWLYYPAVLDPDEIHLPESEIQDYKTSLQAYRHGNLPAALEALPEDRRARRAASSGALLFQAQLFLSNGKVSEAVSMLDLVSGKPALKRALLQLIAAVQRQANLVREEPQTASEWLAQSYLWQAEHDLERALASARRAATTAPDFAFALVRVAELEFGFGRSVKAQDLLDQALEESPENAQAHALHGFLLAARHQREESARAFARAIALDSGLGHAWLGQGLLKIREGNLAAGLQDLQTAAILEPNRSLLHSYLGKAFQHAGHEISARKELEYAKRLDVMDPTPWLYSALLHHQQNRVNQGIDDLERSVALNDNRAVYRSRLMLDQDASVRRANLAHLYEDAGLEELGLREAARGVNDSYSTFSGHLFLANSYRQLLDPGRVALRYETAASTEYLLANLLAPTGAGVLSPTLSQQEYSSLFQQDGVGIVSSTEYLSRGAWNQSSAVYGTYGTTSASFDALYLQDNGQRSNHDLELTSYGVRLKQRLSAKSDLFGQVLRSDGETGDRLPRYDPQAPFTNGGPNTLVRVEEVQEPIAVAGYHHAWSPAQHSLLLAGYVRDELAVNNPQSLIRHVNNTINYFILPYDQRYRTTLELGLIEVQHIAEHGPHALVMGGRYQGGRFDVLSRMQSDFGFGFPFTRTTDNFHAELHRASAYGYYQLELLTGLSVEAGVSYDWMEYPANFRYAPLSDEAERESQVSPKAGLLWRVSPVTSLSAGYARFLTGVSLEQSLGLEPTQVAGINQAFRSVIPETITGANSAEQADTVGLLLDHRFPTRTYVGLAALSLWSTTDRTEGYYSINGTQGSSQSLQNDLDYQEQSLSVNLNQLLDDSWSLGVVYRLSRAELESMVERLPAGMTTDSGAPFQPRQDLTGWLHHARFMLTFNHPSGFFAHGESAWYQQSSQGFDPDQPGDDFWHFNGYVGWRWYLRRAELTLGLLNIADQDYRLSPINLSADIPRERTFYARFRWSF